MRQSEYRPPDPYGDKLMGSRDILPLQIMVEKPELLLSGKVETTPTEGSEK